MRSQAVGLLLALTILAAPATQTIPQDGGAAGAWQKIQKVRTTASVLHTTAHPDDEHGGVIATFSRKDGARLALLTLNRGESGDNAIGPQLFDALGLIRTEELLAAGKYYGVDEQYFTTVVDYGFSKRLDEALEKWGRDAVMRDVVRVIRTTRPWILLSRFQGNERDGHGNHQTAGLITQEAARVAGDATMFPEQVAAGLRPWTPFKVYMGGVRPSEAWTVRIDSGEYSPWLGDSYDNFARLGLSFQRSQNSGRYTPTAGENFGYYTRTATRLPAPAARETTVWDGIDTTYAGLFTMIGRPAPADVVSLMASLDATVAAAASAFTLADPSASVPALVEGLRITRDAMAKMPGEAEARFVLGVKEKQFQDAINTALGLDLTATAQPAGLAEPRGDFAAFAPPPTMAAPVPGQTFEVRVRLANRGGVPIALRGVATGSAGAAGQDGIELETAAGWTATASVGSTVPPSLLRHGTAATAFTVSVAPDAPISSKPYFSRSRLFDNSYTLADPSQFGRPASVPPLVAVAHYSIDGVPIAIRETVRRREPHLPYGDALREVRTVPRLGVTVSPATAVVPLALKGSTVDLTVELVHNADAPTRGEVALTLPARWTSTPARQPFEFARAGEKASYQFKVAPVGIDANLYRVVAVATADGRQYREGYELVEQRDLETRYLYRPSAAEVRGIDVTVVPNLKVGYVMGIGDQVPLGLRQLGAQVTLLGERELASADLSAYDAIMTGTRAYAVRDDLRTYNQRLLAYVRSGGNMIVLYNTQELVPALFAPFPGDLPRNAEEVSEEDSPVKILAPAQQAFNWPNRITDADFIGWIEQRGSKFFASWDAAYTPMISTYDKGQAPQAGGWLTARVGKGTWTYFAYALHRQLPYGVSGAYRITANLLALGRTPQ